MYQHLRGDPPLFEKTDLFYFAKAKESVQPRSVRALAMKGR